MPALSSSSFAASVLPGVLMAGVGILVFVSAEYCWERRQRCRFRDYWKTDPSSPRAEELDEMLPPVASRGSVAQSAVLASQGLEEFPSLVSFFRHRLGRYSLAVLFVAMALLARLLLEPVLQGRLAFTFFLSAVLLTAWVAGTWETLLATILGFVAATWFIVKLQGAFIADLDDWLGAALYVFISVGVVAFMKSERAGWLQALSSDIVALKRLHQLEQERAAPERASPARELLANIVDSAQAPILSVDPQSRILTWNKAAERVFGFSAQEAVNQSLDMLIPPERRAEQQGLLEQVKRGEWPGAWQTALRCKNGSRLEVSLVLSPVLDQAGKLLGASIVVRNPLPGP